MRTRKMIALGAAVLGLIVPWSGARAQGTDFFQRTYDDAVKALDGGKYEQADTLAKVMLGLGSMLSPDQQIKALQVLTASIFTEDKRKLTDSAIVLIRKVVALGSKKMIREITWQGLDDLFNTVVAGSVPGKLTLASRVQGAVVFVDDQSQGPILKLRTVTVKPGVDAKVSIRIEGCGRWDTTVVVRAADSVFLGYRGPACKP